MKRIFLLIVFLPTLLSGVPWWKKYEHRMNKSTSSTTIQKPKEPAVQKTNKRSQYHQSRHYEPEHKYNNYVVKHKTHREPKIESHVEHKPKAKPLTPKETADKSMLTMVESISGLEKLIETLDKNSQDFFKEPVEKLKQMVPEFKKILLEIATGLNNSQATILQLSENSDKKAISV